jgi:5,10-methylenetetrahydromethanopterin reductase
LRIGINELLIDPREDYPKLVNYIKSAENYGVDEFWCESEAYLGLRYDPFVVLGGLAMVTKKIKLAICGVNPYYQNPVEIAASMATLEDMAPMRTAIGIGTGFGEPLEKIGLKWTKPTKSLRECIEVVKLLTSGKKITYNGETVRINDLKLNFAKREIPVYGCVKGPKNLEVTGEVADGLYMTNVSVGYFEYAKEIVKNAAKRKGRDPENIDFIVNFIVFTGHNWDAAYKRARPQTLYLPIITMKYPRIISDYKFTNDEIDILKKRMDEAFQEYMKTGKFVSEPRLPEYLVEKVVRSFAITGTSDEVVRRIKEFQGRVNAFCLQPFNISSEEFIKIVGEEIIPEIK